MSDFQYLSRILITFVFTTCVTIWTFIIFLFTYIKNGFSNPFVNKLRLLPPTVFADPKYGVHQYFRINNARIHYMESGDPSKPLIIFLHGFPEFWYSWRHQIVEFKKDYWCVAMDIRGFGDSEKTEVVSHSKLEVLVEDVRLLIEHLGRKNCIIVSHDFGGFIACRIRDTHPEVISAVVLLASSSIEAWFNEIWNNWSQMIACWQIFVYNLPSIPEKWMLMNNMNFLDRLMLCSGTKYITNDDVECYKYWTGKPPARTSAINCYRANFMLICDEKEVKSNIPILAIYAANDHVLKAGVLKTLKGEYTNLETKDTKLHYVESGDPSKPLMLFIHGFPEFWYTWRHQIVEFKKNYWCVAVDTRGYGDSEKPENVAAYHIDVLVEDVRDLIRQLGRDKAIVVSHDWGGLIACRFRDVYPDAIIALIMLSSTSREAWGYQIWNSWRQTLMSWYVFFFQIPVLPELFFKMHDLSIFDDIFKSKGKNLDAQDIECYKYWFGKPYGMTLPINYYRANLSLNFEKKYIEDKVPMLVANASNDVAISPGLLDIMKTEYAQIETIMIENCGHFSLHEEPEKVNKIIRHFLNKHNIK